MTQSTGWALAASLALALLVTACVGFGEPQPRYACYWLSNVTNKWEAWPEAPTRQRCFELDSCSGGLGASSGGCYKWTTSANAPDTGW